ncbi:hypothetical protein [Bradyrhizobium brasilense]|uniref:hypothetical protein n=1 Tax=Bradyrhizobium brasilense TaxID=1419277 RepID=UPI001E3A3FC9|nr:hypothetical protein [Bradyrhizobium brasilense]MCC8972159.1 hypothetical protein [Bradyrhizobium brasilense]
MVDPTYQAKVYAKQGGTQFVVASGGQLTVESGGKVVVTLPTADPHVVGQLWANSGVVTVSAG